MQAVIIYCFGRSITIKGEDQPCPPHAFSLHLSESWNTSDYAFTGVERQVFNFSDDAYAQYLDLRQVHVTEETNQETKNIRRLLEMSKRIAELEREQFLLQFPVGNGGVTWPTASKALLSLLFFLAVGLTAVHYKFDKLHKRRHHKMLNHVHNTIAAHVQLANKPDQIYPNIDQQLDPVDRAIEQLKNKLRPNAPPPPTPTFVSE